MLCFPHLVQAQDRFVCLTKGELSRWLDQIFHPAVYRYYDAHYTQHLSASYRHALANSKAHQVGETARYQAQQSIDYHLQPEYLSQIWTEILETITNTPGVADFHDPQLFFSAEGTNLQFKTSPSRPTMLEGLGRQIVKFIKNLDSDEINKMLDRIAALIWVKETDIPSEEERKYYQDKRFENQCRKEYDGWYQLMLPHQYGTALPLILDGWMKHMIDNTDYLLDGRHWFDSWAYFIDFEKKEMEVWDSGYWVADVKFEELSEEAMTGDNFSLVNVLEQGQAKMQVPF